jgi:branched-subunit amino acid aminotransferase/4-amino-4-deoxychorismate lyase
MSRKIYISGQFVPQEEAKISVYDHGLLYGDGVFEGLRAYSGKVFRLQEHIERLWNSAKAIWLTIPMTPAQMGDAINEASASTPTSAATRKSSSSPMPSPSIRPSSTKRASRSSASA